MIVYIICGIILSLSQVQCKYDYEYHPKIDGWLKLHKVVATWKEAFFVCHNEGAVLASPLTKDLLREMRLLIDANNNTISYYIGTHARFSPGQYVSIEGVPLENMPVTDMYQTLPYSETKQCLSTHGTNISVESCLLKLPYICYRSNEETKELSVCGTFDKEYQLGSDMESCYKVHRVARKWAEANALCVTEGGHLTVLNDEKEASFVKALFPKKMPEFSWGDTWNPLFVGLRDWDDNLGNGTWLSIHGEPIDQLYNNWHSGQPDASGQLCGALLKDGTLDNVRCNVESLFVCEKNANNTRYSPNNVNQYQ